MNEFLEMENTMIQSNVQNNADLKTNLLLQIGNRFNKTAFSEGNFSDILALNTREIYKSETQLIETNPLPENNFLPTNNEIIRLNEKDFKQENFAQPEPVYEQNSQENMLADDEIVLDNQALNPERQANSETAKPVENSANEVDKVENKPAESVKAEAAEVKTEAPAEEQAVKTDVKPENDTTVNIENKQNIAPEVKTKSVLTTDTEIAAVKTLVTDKNIAQEQILSQEFEAVTGKEEADLQQIVSDILDKQTVKANPEIQTTQAESKLDIASILKNETTVENLTTEAEKVILNQDKPTVEQFLNNQIQQAEIKNAVAANLAEEKPEVVLNVKNVSRETVINDKEDVLLNTEIKSVVESQKPVAEEIKLENPEKAETVELKTQVMAENKSEVNNEKVLVDNVTPEKNQNEVLNTSSEQKKTVDDTETIANKIDNNADNSTKPNEVKNVEKPVAEVAQKVSVKTDKPVVETSPKTVQNETPKVIQEKTEQSASQYEHFTKLNNQNQQAYVSTNEKYAETEKAVSGEQVTGTKDKTAKTVVENNEVTVKTEVSTKKVEGLAEASNQNVNRAVMTKQSQVGGTNMRSLISKIHKIIETSEFTKPTQTKFVIDGQKYGDVEIEFVKKASENQAMIRVASEEVKAELDKHMPELRETLQEKGISMSALNVEVSQNQQKESPFNAESGKNFARNMKQSGYSKGSGEGDEDENIASRNYGYNTMELIA